LTYTKLREQHSLGAKFKTTTISEEFTYEDFKKQYKNGADLLCIIKPDGMIEFNTVKTPKKPAPGDKVIALVASLSIPDEHESQLA
jgi:hypothetical protein